MYFDRKMLSTLVIDCVPFHVLFSPVIDRAPFFCAFYSRDRLWRRRSTLRRGSRVATNVSRIGNLKRIRFPTRTLELSPTSCWMGRRWDITAKKDSSNSGFEKRRADWLRFFFAVDCFCPFVFDEEAAPIRSRIRPRVFDNKPPPPSHLLPSYGHFVVVF